MLSTPQTITCCLDLSVFRVVVVVVILTLVVILAQVGYPPALVLGVVTAALAATGGPHPAVDVG